MEDDESTVLPRVKEADIAISTLLHSSDLEKKKEANKWLSELFELPVVWTVALYVAFPPSHLDRNGTWPSLEVRFFALNMLLSKLRSDTGQLPSQDSQQVYDALLQQLPAECAGMLRSRLCLAIAAAAARNGVEACHKLVSMAVGEPMEGGEIGMEKFLALEVLTALAEETLLRFHSQTWEVHQCLEDCTSWVLQLLEQLSDTAATTNDSFLMCNVFVCLERWRQGGVTLAELYTQYPHLYNSLVAALAAPDRPLFEAASAALIEFISEVDVLPGRDEAVQVALAGILKQRAQYVAGAALPVGGGPEAEARAQGLCALLVAMGVAEAHFVARAEPPAIAALEWLVDATGAGARGRLDWASMAAEVWPRLASVSPAKRGAFIQPSLFTAVTQAVMSSASYCVATDADEDELLLDELVRFREGPASDALTACYSELHNNFLVNLSAQIQGSPSWQAVEVALYAVRAVSERLLAVVQGREGGVVKPLGKPALVVGPEEPAFAVSFLRSLLLALPGATAVAARETMRSPETAVVEGALQVIQLFASWAASDMAVLEASLRYALGSLVILPERRHAAAALRGLCEGAASDLAGARALGWMMSAYSEAEAKQQLHIDDRVNIVQGLATIAAALPQEEAQAALAQLATPALSLLRHYAALKELSDGEAAGVEDSVRLLTSIVACGGARKWADKGVPHPLLPLLQESWPSLEKVAGDWAENGTVAAVVCQLWAAIAREVGAALEPVLPQVVAAATHMFTTHYHPSCLTCLQEIVVMPREGARGSQEVSGCLAACLPQIVGCVPLLDHIHAQSSLPSPRGKGDSVRRSSGMPKQGRARTEPSEALGGVCEIGRSFLRSEPAILFSSPAFLRLCQCAVGGVQWKEVDSSLSAIQFLSDVLSWHRNHTGANHGRDAGMEEDVVIVGGRQAVESAVGCLGAILVEEILRGLGKGEIGERRAEAMAGVLYELTHCFRSATEGAMLTTLASPHFPAKRGSLTDSDKRHFVAVATRLPIMHQLSFVELMSDFSQVCQGLSPADILVR